MVEIRRYILVDKQDREGTEEYDSLHDAMVVANLNDHGELAIVARTYEYADTELIWTPDGSDVWPPREETD